MTSPLTGSTECFPQGEKCNLYLLRFEETLTLVAKDVDCCIKAPQYTLAYVMPLCIATIDFSDIRYWGSDRSIMVWFDTKINVPWNRSKWHPWQCSTHCCPVSWALGNELYLFQCQKPLTCAPNGASIKWPDPKCLWSVKSTLAEVLWVL